MKLNKSIILLVLLSILGCSCENNVFYFSLDSQMIKRCNNKGIKNLEIDNDSLKLYYSINWILQEKAPQEVNLSNINNGYKIILNGIKVIPNADFQLTPNSFYKITHRSNGDSGSDEIIIYLSKNKKVLKSSKSSCN